MYLQEIGKKVKKMDKENINIKIKESLLENG